MPATRLSSLAVLGLVFLLQACASTPAAEQSPDADAEPIPIPELTLNLPEQGSSECVPRPVKDYTFLDKGVSALVAGDHAEAVQYFERYQRLESSPEADWEVGIALAYDMMLPQSPNYNPRAAMESYLRLTKQALDGMQFHEKVLMMRDSLASLVAAELRISGLRNEKASLTTQLDKREEALKRLRELTLGQKGAAL